MSEYSNTTNDAVLFLLYLYKKKKRKNNNKNVKPFYYYCYKYYVFFLNENPRAACQLTVLRLSSQTTK